MSDHADLDALRRAVGQIKQKLAVEASFKAARRKQLYMLPPTPQVEGYEFHVIYQPAADVGGDFYDFVPISATELGIVVGDITGHGIEAAVLMGMVKKSLNIFARTHVSPVDVLTITNAEIHQDLDRETFVSVFYGLLNVEKGTIRFARAGHTPPILLNPGEGRVEVLKPAGMVLGIDPGPRFQQSLEEKEIQLKPGDVFLEYTDGIVEAYNKKREEFGTRRLLEVLSASSVMGIREILDGVEREVRAFTGVSAPADDICLVGLKVQKPTGQRLFLVEEPSPKA